MNGFEVIGILLAALQLVIAFFVAASLSRAQQNGAKTAATIYLILAFATIIWITRQVLWQP